MSEKPPPYAGPIARMFWPRSMADESAEAAIAERERIRQIIASRSQDLNYDDEYERGKAMAYDGLLLELSGSRNPLIVNSGPASAPRMTDAEKLRAAAAVLRNRMKAKGKEPFMGMVFVRTLERWADREWAAK